MNEGALSEVGRMLAESLAPVESETNFDIQPMSNDTLTHLRSLEEMRLERYVSGDPREGLLGRLR